MHQVSIDNMSSAPTIRVLWCTEELRYSLLNCRCCWSPSLSYLSLVTVSLAGRLFHVATGQCRLSPIAAVTVTLVAVSCLLSSSLFVVVAVDDIAVACASVAASLCYCWLLLVSPEVASRCSMSMSLPVALPRV